MLKIAMIYGHETGVEYYRLLQPAKYLNRLSLCEVRPYSMGKRMPIMRIDKKPGDETCLEEIGEWADMFVASRVATLENLSMLQGLQKTYNKPMVYELDDDVTCIDKDHPGYANLRQKNAAEVIERIKIRRSDYDGYSKKMRIVDTAEVPGHADEMMIMVMNGLDAEWIAKRQAEISDAVTVTTESIRQSYLPANKNIYILKNCIDFELWDKLQPPTQNEKVRIGWAGGMQHRKDIDIIVPVMERLFDKYPNIEFHHSPSMSSNLGNLKRYYSDRVHQYEWVNVKDWPASYASYNFDIALAPVTSTRFNQGKSNLKWLENSARRIPTVASRWDTYSSIKDGETGFLAGSQGEWIEKIGKLVESTELRKTIGDNAYRDVYNNFNARNNAFEYSRVYQEIKANYKEVDYGVLCQSSEAGITCS